MHLFKLVTNIANRSHWNCKLFNLWEAVAGFLSQSVVSLGQHIRGTLLGYGIANLKGKKGLKASIQTILDGETNIPANVISVLTILWLQYKQSKNELKDFEKEKNSLTRQIEPCKRLMKIESVGVHQE